MCREGRAVRVGDGPDDRQAKAVPAVALADTFGAEPLERLEEPAKLPGRHHRPAVADRQHRASLLDAGTDADPSAGHVVPERVVDQVRDQALRQPRVATARRRLEREVQPDRPVTGLSDPRGEGGQIERLASVDAAFSRRERQQPVDEPLGPLPEDEHLLARLPQCRRGRRWIGQRHLQDRSLCGERGAQFVGRAGDEVPLRGERGFQPGEQRVQRLPEPAELVGPAVHREPAAQIARRDGLGGRGDGAHRPEQPGGEQPARSDRQQHQHRQGDDDLQGRGVGVYARVGCPDRPAADMLDLFRRGERQGQHHQPGDQERTGVQQREPQPDGHAAPIR